jgi:hypothetical protein
LHRGEGRELTEEYPRPPLIITNFDLTQSTRQKSAKSTTERRSAVEQTTAQQHLPPSIEESQVNDNTSQNAALKQAKKRTAHHQSGKTLREAHERANQAPHCDESGKVDACAEALDKPVGRDIGDDIGDVENQQGDVVLRALEAELGGEAGDVGIADVGAVDEREQPVLISSNIPDYLHL